MSHEISPRTSIFPSTGPVAVGGVLATKEEQHNKRELLRLGIFLGLGIIFGFTLIKGEAISWFRMQEMFRFESIHMYGIMGVAVLIGMTSVEIIRRRQRKSLLGDDVRLVKRPFERANLYGGLVFGLGWGIVGLCPGPIYVLIGSGMASVAIVLVFALLGTFAYGVLKPRLPH
jgi:uncharacterized protein